MERALDELGLSGVIMACSIQRTRSPAEPEFEPLYAELDRRGGVLYFHPSGNGLCSPLLNDYGLTYAAGGADGGHHHRHPPDGSRHSGGAIPI